MAYNFSTVYVGQGLDKTLNAEAIIKAVLASPELIKNIISTVALDTLIPPGLTVTDETVDLIADGLTTFKSFIGDSEFITETTKMFKGETHNLDDIAMTSKHQMFFFDKSAFSVYELTGPSADVSFIEVPTETSENSNTILDLLDLDLPSNIIINPGFSNIITVVNTKFLFYISSFLIEKEVTAGNSASTVIIYEKGYLLYAINT